MGLCFMRWYNIAAKSYEIDHSEQYGSNSNLDRVKRRLNRGNLPQAVISQLQKDFTLKVFISHLELKMNYQLRAELFRQLSISKDIKSEQKARKIIYNIK
jgi:hypothetical protein